MSLQLRYAEDIRPSLKRIYKRGYNDLKEVIKRGKNTMLRHCLIFVTGSIPSGGCIAARSKTAICLESSS